MIRIQHTGFTIVELLIVIVVIGVLASIVIVAYQGVTNRANDTAVQSDLHETVQTIETAKTANSTDAPPQATQTGLQSLIKVSKNAYYPQGGGSALYCRNDTSYALIMRSRSGTTYGYSTSPAVTSADYPMTPGVIQISSTALWGGSDIDWACKTRGGIVSTDTGYGSFFLMQAKAWAPWIP